ncbi:MAG TPA: GNAT family N-acetyltransferase, partial [Gemmatimonadales bacterium]|nr:GNAT family N-acetyltransferase [Gemmatimonadales bacterium]
MTSSPDVTVAPFTGAAADWDALVARSAGGTHFHRWGWKRVMERALGHECTFLGAERGGELRGVLPLTSVRSLVFGRFLVSMPFVNYGGPLGDAETVQALASDAVARADRARVKLLELRSRVQLPLDLPVSHRKITVVLDLPPGDPKHLWDGLPAKVRSQIRRPQKEGVTVHFGADQLDGFYRVFAHHMRDLGTPVQSRRLFEEIQAEFPDVWFGCARLKGEPVAGGCGFRWGNEFEITWASSLRAHQTIAPNMALYWGFLERCVEQGVTLFNFGRCTPDSGTHRFKRQWGSRD